MDKKPNLYVETTIISYHLNETSRDIVIASRQLMARDWWNGHSKKYRLFISELVIEELTEGDPSEIVKRKNFLDQNKNSFELLRVNKEVLELAEIYFKKLSLPEDAKDDSIHLALTVIHEIEYLLTWNLRHFARQERVEEIRRLNLKLGKYHPNIVTPEDII